MTVHVVECRQRQIHTLNHTQMGDCEQVPPVYRLKLQHSTHWKPTSCSWINVCVCVCWGGDSTREQKLRKETDETEKEAVLGGRDERDEKQKKEQGGWIPGLCAPDEFESM